MRGLRGCILLVLPFVCSFQAFAGDPQWVEVRSPNFSVITDAGEKRGRDVAFHFEQMRAVFGTLMTRANVNLAVPLQIVAFRNTKEMRQVAPLFNGKPTELAGLFQGGEDRSFIMLDMSVENPWTVVFHEYAHRLMDGNLSFRSDPWFEEGFAEYFSSIEVDNKEARVGKIPEQTYLILHQMGMMKVSDLFRVQQYTKTYNENGDRRSTFYAESGLVVHYLYDNQLIPKLSIYFDVLQVQKKPVEQAVQAAFGMSPEQFDKVLRNYLSSERFMYHPIPTPAGIQAAQFTVAPVSAVDAHAVLADIHAHSPDYRERAMAEFQDVLKTDPTNQAALRGIGYLYLQQKDFEHASDYLRRAAAGNSKDPRVHYYYAMLLNMGGSTGEDRYVEIKKELEASIALDPKLADAYALLGYAQAVSGEPEKGIATLKKAVELSPRDERYKFNLANVYMANQKMDEAIAIFRSLAGSSTPEVAQMARQSLAQAEQFKSQDRILIVRSSQLAGDNPRPTLDTGAQAPAEPTVPPPVVPVSAPVHFVKGKVNGLDCSDAPRAVMTVASGARTIVLHIKDRDHVVILGADAFSCEWKDKRVAVNYRDRSDGHGDVVSIEIQ